MKNPVHLIIPIILTASLWPTPAGQPVSLPEPSYEINGHYYSIEQIAYAVSIREGSTSCGIRLKGEYIKLPDQEAYLLCRDKLKNQIDKYGFATALKVWKTVPPFEPYIRDVISILEKNAYQR